MSHLSGNSYHAVQIAFARNIGQKNGLYWNKLSEKQMVWNNDKYITAAEYVKELSEHYSYMMEYNYYNESEERTHKFMYDLCQWIGYSVIFQKFCIEWEEKRKIEVFIPNELIDEIEQLYIGLRDNHDINEIEKNYIKIQVKFEQLNKLQICGDENYFLSDRQT